MTSDPYALNGAVILPSILSADFSKLGSEIDDVLSHGADCLHLDILDGHFAPNISFGPPVIRGVRRSTNAFLDAHLMIENPLTYAKPIVDAGANGVTFHVETVSDVAATAKELKKLGVRVGVTARPATPVETLWPALDYVDLVLVMSVVPGFSGQKFMPSELSRAEQIKKRLRPDQRMQIDGGIKPDNIKSARSAGVDWFVVASAIFDQPNRAAAIAALRAAMG